MQQNLLQLGGAKFDPDLLVEVTSVCDLNCPGCYSPTLRTREAPAETFRQHPEFFLSAESLHVALGNMSPPPKRVSLRGGEPSRHPKLASLIEVAASFCETVWVETHARWLAEEGAMRDVWIGIIRKTGAIVKVSFDRMHHLRTDVLRQITDCLEKHDLQWMIAITEPDEAAFLRTRQRCSWIEEGRILFQHLVTDHRLLVHPPLGTLAVNGSFRARPTVKSEFIH